MKHEKLDWAREGRLKKAWKLVIIDGEKSRELERFRRSGTNQFTDVSFFVSSELLWAYRAVASIIRNDAIDGCSWAILCWCLQRTWWVFYFFSFHFFFLLLFFLPQDCQRVSLRVKILPNVWTVQLINYFWKLYRLIIMYLFFCFFCFCFFLFFIFQNYCVNRPSLWTLTLQKILKSKSSPPFLGSMILGCW